MSLYFRTQNKFILVTGSTYPHRLKLKELGGVFVPDRKAWRLPLSQDSLKSVEGLCEQQGGGSLESEALENEDLTALQQRVSLRSTPQEEVFVEAHGLSISQLYQKVEGVLAQSFSSPFWLFGEIESLAHRSQGIYITLAEKEGASQNLSLSVSGLLWQNTLRDLEKKHSKEVLKDLFVEGLKLCVLCRLTLYKGRGNLSLHILDVNPSFTKGQLALEREKTVKALKKEGLYEANKKRVLSRFPFRVGLITAEGSRAYSDFCHQLVSQKSPAQVFFAPATMQGAQTYSSLKVAFTTLLKKKCDIIVLTRGGGSVSDLRVFDDFNVASLIAYSPVPVLAAIGHHEDSPVCEEICFQAAKTPTAAAEFILRHFEQGVSYLDELTLQMTKSLERSSEFCHKKTELLCLKLSDSLKESCTRSDLLIQEKRFRLGQEALSVFARKELELQQKQSSLEASSQKCLVSHEESLQRIASKLESRSRQSISFIELQIEALSSKVLSFDPRPWLHKGWTRLYKKDGSLVRGICSLADRDELEAHFLDGKASLEVTKTQKRK